jgi:O-antigen ligase
MNPLPLQAVMLSLALLLPTLLAYSMSPSATLLNSLLAAAAWGGVLQVHGDKSVHRGWREVAPLWAALALLLVGVQWAAARGLPGSLALQATYVIMLPMAVAWAAAVTAGPLAGQAEDGHADTFANAMLLCGLVNTLIAMVQVFAPDWTNWADGSLIARSGLPGRAVGNLRQPNHLASLLMWALIALVPVAQRGRWWSLRLNRPMLALMGALLILAEVLSASRTGMAGMLLLAVWGAADKRLARHVRLGMLSAPLVYALFWAGMDAWARETAHTFFGAVRVAAGGDLSSHRFAIWSNTLDLIRMHPLAGVGFGEFNFAWSLTPFPGRPVAFFDHTHNLPLQFAVELGLPLATLVMALLVWALWQAAQRSWRVQGEAGTASRAALMMVLMIGLHSMLEYPLWYAYFLLPTAWAWGLALRQPLRGGDDTRDTAPQDNTGPKPSPWVRALGIVMVLGTLFAMVDYRKVTVIYSGSSSGEPAMSLPERIDRGRTSLLFEHHADYAAVTTIEPPSLMMESFATTTHSLLDTRLMIAWARALDETGQHDKASYLAERLREFKNPDADSFFALCSPAAAASGALPFQCVPSKDPHSWQEFLH